MIEFLGFLLLYIAMNTYLCIYFFFNLKKNRKNGYNHVILIVLLMTNDLE